MFRYVDEETCENDVGNEMKVEGRCNKASNDSGATTLTTLTQQNVFKCQNY